MGRWMDRAEARREERGDILTSVLARQGPADPMARNSAQTTTDLYDIRHTPSSPTDSFRAWLHRNVELLTEEDRRRGHDPGGYCAEHHRALSYPEQKRGACSWCVPVDAEREPEYWQSHWRRFTERS